MIEVTEQQLSEYKTAVIDLDLAKKEVIKLNEKNTELSENFKNAKTEWKAKSEKKLLEVVNAKETLENENKLFKESLNIWEDIEDLKTHLETMNSDIAKYSEIKVAEWEKTKAEIKTYTDFLNTKDKEYLTWKVDMFWESVLENAKALKDFAINQGYKTDGEGPKKAITVGKIENVAWWDKGVKNQDWFNSALSSWDIDKARDIYYKD